MVDGAERDRGSRKGKKEAWNVSPVGEGSCVKGNSKFTGGVLAEADEKFRENNEKIKRRNVCTHVASLGRFFHPSPTCPAFMHRATLPLFFPPPPPGMLAVAGQGGEGIEIVSKIQRREVPRGQNG